MDVLDELERIVSQLNAISNQLKYEEWITKQELKDRTALNLSGKEAIEHYNKWMKTAGLQHLVIEV